LKCDLVIFYEGYNDLETTPADDTSQGAWRTTDLASSIADLRWTGYFPILPLVLSEKAMH